MIRGCVLWALGLALCFTSSSSAAGPSVPVIYCTDLFHPHDDPDDHFDLATIFAIPELDIRVVVLDQGAKQRQRPGRVAVDQLNRVTGRRVPAVIGLAEKLKGPDDMALDQVPEFQDGVNAILRVLRESTVPVKIAAVGSMRDVVAAYNREPGLFRRQVSMVLAFIGEASDPAFLEYNVELDVHAFVRLMRSDLPVFWVPCFDGGLWQNKGHASFWKASHEALLKDAAPEVIQYFIYAMEHRKSPPKDFIQQPVAAESRTKLFAGTRNLWCTAIFGALCNREVVATPGGFALSVSSPDSLEPGRVGLFGFREVEVSVGDDGLVRNSGRGRRLMRFQIHDPARYAEGMTEATASLLRNLGRKAQ